MDSTLIEREAANWLARRDSGDWMDADEAAFAEWQSQSTAHRVAVIRLKRVWRRADRLQALGAGVPRAHVPLPGSWHLPPFLNPSSPAARAVSESADAMWLAEGGEALAVGGVVAANDVGAPAPASLKRATRRTGLQAVAASFVLAVITGVVWYAAGYDPNRYHTAVGGLQTVPMTDGSTVTLNTASAVHIDVTPQERGVVLERGEAFFEVAHDPARPFVVHAGHQRIIAVGTKFSVLREAQGARVVVTEGQVRVEDADRGGAVATPVSAGSIAQADKVGVLVKRASIADAEAYVSWRSGYIALHDTPLPEAITELNRYNTKKLVIRDPSLKNIKVGGNLRATNAAAFARVLEQGFPIRATEEGDEIVLTAR